MLHFRCKISVAMYSNLCKQSSPPRAGPCYDVKEEVTKGKNYLMQLVVVVVVVVVGTLGPS